MFKSSLILSLALGGVLLVGGCKPDETPTNPPKPSTNRSTDTSRPSMTDHGTTSPSMTGDHDHTAAPTTDHSSPTTDTTGTGTGTSTTSPTTTPGAQ